MRKIKTFLLSPTYAYHKIFIVVALLIFDTIGLALPTILQQATNVVFWAFCLLVLHPFLADMLTMLYALIKTGFKLPTKENYTNKSVWRVARGLRK